MRTVTLQKKATFGVAVLALIGAYFLGRSDERLGRDASFLSVAMAQSGASETPRKTYYPNTEKLGPNEMRIISLGTGMPNQRKSQASACWLVELGNGEKFLFDLGTGSVANLSVLEI